MKSNPLDVIIIAGAPGTGKSQAARCLTSYFRDGVKVEVDVLRSMVISVDWKNQREHVDLLQVAARLTHEFHVFGFRPVIVVDTFSGDKIHGFLETLRRLNEALIIRIFGLHVSDEALLKRLKERPADEFKDFGISKKLNADVLRHGHRGGQLVDTSELTPEETAGEIYKRLILTGSAWPPTGPGSMIDTALRCRMHKSPR
ncbi:MAG: AAA family ATPase [Planctomycetota bacterium]